MRFDFFWSRINPAQQLILRWFEGKLGHNVSLQPLDSHRLEQDCHLKQQKSKSSSKAEFGTFWEHHYFPAEAFTDSSKHFPTQTNLLAEHGWAWLSGAVFLPRNSGDSWTQISLSASVKSRFIQAEGDWACCLSLITEQGPAFCSLSTLLILPTFLLAVLFARMLVRSQNERRQKNPNGNCWWFQA